MKKVLIFILFLFIFIISIFLGKNLYTHLNTTKISSSTLVETQKNENTNNIIENTPNIIKRMEFTSSSIFEVTNVSNYETDLMANNMTFDTDSRLYYKIITNIEDYAIYKERLYYIPEMTAEDFEKNFVVILANENERSFSETDLIIYDVIDEGNISHIIVKQRENPVEHCKNNVFFAIVNNSALKEHIDVEIQYN